MGHVNLLFPFQGQGPKVGFPSPPNPPLLPRPGPQGGGCSSPWWRVGENEAARRDRIGEAEAGGMLGQRTLQAPVQAPMIHQLSTVKQNN